MPPVYLSKDPDEELNAYISYRRLRKTLCYWQTQSGNEVDFIIGDECAVEVKASEQIQDKHLKALKLLTEEGVVKHYYLVSRDKISRKVGEIHVIFWQEFLSKLWQDKII